MANICTTCSNIQNSSTFCPHSVFVFCVDLRTNSNYFTVQHWLIGFYNRDGVCLLCGMFYILRSAHNVFMCFVWIWEQTPIISLYSTDWLVFTTKTVCVYCAVRSTFYVLLTQCIYVFSVDLRTNSDYFTVQHWLISFYNRDGVCLLRGTFYILRSATECVWVLCGSENKQRLFHCTALTGWGFSRNCSFKYDWGKFHSSEGQVASYKPTLPHMSSIRTNTPFEPAWQFNTFIPLQSSC